MPIDPATIERDSKGRIVKRPEGAGRVKGRPNKLTVKVREMIETALHEAGGIDYLVEQAHKEPRAFLVLLGKVIPREIKAEVGASLENLLAASYAAGANSERKAVDSGAPPDVIDVPAKPKQQEPEPCREPPTT